MFLSKIDSSSQLKKAVDDIFAPLNSKNIWNCQLAHFTNKKLQNNKILHRFPKGNSTNIMSRWTLETWREKSFNAAAFDDAAAVRRLLRCKLLKTVNFQI